MHRARISVVAVVAVLVVVAGCAGGGGTQAVGNGADASGATMVSGAESQQVGVSAGGAQDANAFRTNVREGYVPQPTDLTYEGLFHDYYFDTGQSEPCESRFCPSYSAAVTRDPLSNETERFVTVGLNSGLTKADVQGQPLNLVVVVDTSGSMGESFDRYYYDGGQKQEVEDNQPKMRAAKRAVRSMLDRLDGEDRVSVVGYDNDATVVQDLARVSELDRDSLDEAVGDLRADGGTNLDSGIRAAVGQVAGAANDAERETRVVYVTDAMPNQGETSASELERRLQSNADDGIHTTFVGVGVDFNTRLTEAISTVKGANYYAVHSPAQFEQRMNETFSYMVTPLAHNLSLRVASDGYRIENVYGSPQADQSTGELLHVTTLFPSRREGNRTEGGVVLLEVERTVPDATLELVASYETPEGDERTVTRTVGFDRHDAPYYGSTGVRKAVTLAEYGTIMRNWMVHERALATGESHEPPAGVEYTGYDSQWEQTSVPLTVSEPYGERLAQFREYFRAQKGALGAERMSKDLALLDRLLDRTDDGTARDSEETAEPTAGESETSMPAAAMQGGGGDAGSGGGLFGWDLPLFGLANLLLTVVVAGYGLKCHQRGQDGTGATGGKL